VNDTDLSVGHVGAVIVARLRGIPTAEVLLECEQQIAALSRETRHASVLYDALELMAPDTSLVLLQQRLGAVRSEMLGTRSLRTAILVANTRIAYLARIAFGHAGETSYRVFYGDMGAALRWLEAPPAMDPGAAES